MKKNEMSYAIKYDFIADVNTSDGWTIEDSKDGKYGLCDACVFVSIVREGHGAHKGSTSHKFISYDGHNEGQSIPTTEMFNVWGSLAHSLSEDSNAPLWQKEICIEAVEKIRKVILS